jgi:hypothetical protein
MKKFLSIGLVFFATVVVAGSAAAQSPVAVTTYHYDTLRTGWNSNETTLTPQNVNATTFGILKTVTLDNQVDAQPLIVPNQTIAGSTHDVVYVATESNTIYAIDTSSGAKLLGRNLGSPVPKPLECGNNAAVVGITSTPVIDLTSQTLFVVAYVNGSPPIYQLHALNLSDLTDKVPAVTVAATHILTNGATYTFNAAVQRQRPALLESNGAIYAGFGSFCDFNATTSRGWLLGWNASTLTPGTANQLNATQPPSTTNFFLSSIWMSGYGIATAGTDLFFSTGNSNCNLYVTPVYCPATQTYDSVTNIQQSVVKIHGDLNSIDGIFTPSDAANLDMSDGDLGAGGVLLLPPQSGSIVSLAVAGGKDGKLFLLDANNMGGFTPGGPNKVLDTHQLAGCWCGPSWFTGSDGIGRVVTSEGSFLQTWQLQLSPSPKLVLEGSGTIATGQLQDPGFFTSVSSNGTTAGTAIIWAVGRPTVPTAPTVTLYAFAATPSDETLTQLFSSPAGYWPETGADADIVPVVANGKVYVAAYRSLIIFGIIPVPAASRIALQPIPIVSPESPNVITGTLLAVNGSTLTLQTHTGKNVKIDASQAMKNQRVGAPLNVGMALTVQGSSIEGSGALLATSMYRAKGP